MRYPSAKQLHNLDKDTLILMLSSMQEQLDEANRRLADNNRQIELLIEQIRIMNQRQFGRKSESKPYTYDGQMTIFDLFNEAEALIREDLKEPEITEVIISSYHRKKSKGKREEDLEGLPARIIEHKLSEE